MSDASMPSSPVEVKSVLVATDLSEFSEKALEHGIAVARHYGSILHLVHVVSSLGFTLAGPEAVELAAEASQRDMDCLIHRFTVSGRLSGLEVRPSILTGNIDEEIDAFVRTHCVDLILAGSHGRTGIPRLVLGSVPQLIAKRCSCPVLTIGPRASGPWIDNADDCERPLLLATASTMNPGRAMAFAIALAQNLEHRLFVLQTDPCPHSSVADQSAHDENAAWPKAQLGSDVTKTANVDQPLTFLTGGCDPAEGILRAAQRINAATILLATHRDELSYRPFRHSRNVIDRVNREAKCPVLTIRG